MTRAVLVLAFAALLAAVGCGGQSLSPPTSASDDAVPTPQAAPSTQPSTATAVIPTTAAPLTTVATAAPPTDGVAPTTAVTAVDPDNISARTIVEELKRAGLPIGDITVFDENTDPDGLLGRPHRYVDKAGFADTRLDAKDQAAGNGIVEVFNDPSDAVAWKIHIEEASGNRSLAGSHVYQSYKYVLRLTFDAPPDRAREYETTFLNVVAAE